MCPRLDNKPLLCCTACTAVTRGRTTAGVAIRRLHVRAHVRARQTAAGAARQAHAVRSDVPEKQQDAVGKKAYPS